MKEQVRMNGVAELETRTEMVAGFAGNSVKPTKGVVSMLACLDKDPGGGCAT